MLIINNLSIFELCNLPQIKPPHLPVFKQRDEICPADGINLLFHVKMRREEFVLSVQFLLRNNESAAFIVENAQLVVPAVHENENCTRPGVLMEDIADIVDHRIPLVAKADIALAILITHSCCKTKHNCGQALSVGQSL